MCTMHGDRIQVDGMWVVVLSPLTFTGHDEGEENELVCRAVTA